MLEESPLALVTPYASVVDPLPTEKDRTRLANLTNLAYCTAPSDIWAPPRKGQPVDRVIRESGRQIRAIDARVPGHVRVRRRFQGEPDFRIETFDGAHQLINEALQLAGNPVKKILDDDEIGWLQSLNLQGEMRALLRGVPPISARESRSRS
jgi:hypothetical protein